MRVILAQLAGDEQDRTALAATYGGVTRRVLYHLEPLVLIVH